MARVKVQQANDQLMMLSQEAQHCRGEFFGNDGEELVFGFANNGHAKLFARKMSKSGIAAVLFAVC
ncbi:MAG TPA: hypothetical protein VMW24_15895 [Sedimentisphaerales bacterium]|nr:hypothetical protein [Sedimentisphaerales bacterium]